MQIKETIIFSNSFNEAELLRTIAKNGNITLGTRVMNDSELCSYILMKNGITMSGRFISDKEADFIYLSQIGGVLEDSKNMRSSINTLRDCVPGKLSNNTFDNIFGKGNELKFPLKKEKIVDAYTKYESYKKNDLYDKHDMINFIIDRSLKVDNVSIKYYKEMGITELFKKMLNNVFSDVEEVSITSLYPKENNCNNKHLLKAYGKKNEIDYIFNKINEDQLKLDECQIVLVDSKDIVETLVYTKKFNIPYTSTIGAPFIESNVGKMLKALIDLKNKNYGVDGYIILTNCSSFDRDKFKAIINDDYKYDDFIKYIGWLRLNFKNNRTIYNVYDKANESIYYDALNSFNKDLKQGIVKFIDKYTLDDEFKPSCILEIEELLSLKKKYNISDDVVDDFDLLQQLLSSSLSSTTSSNGKIHITNLDKAFSSIRKHNFIVGLDDSYPGNPIENYLIYDDDYMKTGSNKYVSSNIIEEKIVKTKAFISMCDDVNLSYSYYDLLDLKDKNPSSIIYDEIIYALDSKNNLVPTNLLEYGFKNSNLTSNIDVINAKTSNKIPKDIPSYDYSTISFDSNELLNRSYSPSGIRSFFDNKLAFVLSTFLKISIDDSDDIYTIMPANEKGSIMHKLMEGFQKNQTNRAEFIKKADEEYERFLKMRPAVINSQKDTDKKVFLADIEKLYDDDPGNEFIASEVLMKGKIGNINFSGKFDRLEKTSDGKYIVVDYKTGHSFNHTSNDVISCIQGLIYAYLIEVNGINGNMIRVDRVEFRYPNIRKIAYIDYNDTTKDEMISKINEFEEAIINGNFKCDLELKEYSFIDKYMPLLSLIEGVQK